MLIKREDAIWAMRNLLSEHVADTAEIRLNELPSAEPRKGKWMVTEKGLLVTVYECSECKRHVMDDTGYDVAEDYPFCHCGADMGGEDNA